MDEHFETMMNAVLDRLRETEAQTREQNILLKSHDERIENFSKVTDKFLEHLVRREERDEKREKTLLKVIVVLVGAVIATALGPKAATALFDQFATKTAPFVNDRIPWHGDGDRRVYGLPMREDDIA